MVRHAKTILRLLPTNYLSVFDHFAGLSLKGLSLNKNDPFNHKFAKTLSKLKLMQFFTRFFMVTQALPLLA